MSKKVFYLVLLMIYMVFFIADETEFRNFIVWLEDQKSGTTKLIKEVI